MLVPTFWLSYCRAAGIYFVGRKSPPALSDRGGSAGSVEHRCAEWAETFEYL